MAVLSITLPLAWALVISRFSSLVVPVEFLPRPLTAAAIIAIAIGGITVVALPNLPTNAHIVVAWIAEALLIRPGASVLPILLATALVTLMYYWRRVRRRPSQFPLNALRRSLTVGTASFAVVASIQASSVAVVVGPPLHRSDTAATSPIQQRNLYLILADGYPRSDMLESRFGFDNSRFETALRSLGFNIYPEAISPNLDTAQSLAAVMGHSPTQGEGIEALRAWRTLLATQPQLDPWRTAGYRVVLIAPPVGQSFMDGADEVVSSGQLTDFEADLLANSLAGTLLRDPTSQWLVESQRHGLDASLRSLDQLASEPHRHVVVAHLMAPHPPFLWRADGSPNTGPDCWPRCHMWTVTQSLLGLDLNEYAALTRSQVANLNDALVPALTALRHADPDGIVVLFGDHGTRYSRDDDPAEAHAAFLAAYTPGFPNLFSRGATIPRILRDLAEAYTKG